MPSWMHKEILSQPSVLETLFTKEWKRIQAFADIIRKKNIQYIGFVARGTSDHATLLAKYIFETHNRIPVFHFNPSIFTLYKAELNLKNFLVLGVSQSGESTDVVEVLKKAKAFGALSCAVTNEKKSAITRAADFTFYLHAGKERALAATKTYTATLYFLYMLSSAMMENIKGADALQKIPEALHNLLQSDEKIRELCQRYRYMNECAVLARGFNLATAQETALKLEETCEVKALAFSAADFLHGPIVLAEQDFPVFVYAAKGVTLPLMKNVLRALLEKKADVCVVTNAKEALTRGAVTLHIHAPFDEMYTPLFFIAAGQLLAYHIANLKGLNPDKPRYLTKVTRTM